MREKEARGCQHLRIISEDCDKCEIGFHKVCLDCNKIFFYNECDKDELTNKIFHPELLEREG